MKNSPFSLIGIPLDLGAENLGVDIGPNAFRYQKIVEKLQSVGATVVDHGNIVCEQRSLLSVGDPALKYAEEIVRVSNIAAKVAAREVKKGNRIIGLGGDHSISLGLISGASDALNGDLGLIYLDTHGDMNTKDTTLTGNIHGMHLAALLGYGAHELTSIATSDIKIKKENLIHIGGNDFDKEENIFVKKENIYCFKIIDLLAHGLGPLFSQIEKLSQFVKQVWVSIDLDVIDKTYAPGAGMPNSAGLTYREISAIAHFIGHKTHVVGVDVVEYNPLLDIEGKTAELGIELIARMFGYDYSWYTTDYMKKNKLL